MFAAFFFTLLQTVSPAQPVAAPTRVAALPALAAKAPGGPEYGLHISSIQGQFILTNLRYTPQRPLGWATGYRVRGPAGMGPYRLGIELGGPLHYVKPGNGWYQGQFFEIIKALDGGAAKSAGLDEDWSILSVDGQSFGWNLGALISYMSTRPAIEVLALKRKGWGLGYKQKTFQIRMRKLDAPVDPADGELVPDPMEALQPYLKGPGIWSDLVALRSALPRFTPLPVEIAGRRMWVVRGPKNPHPLPSELGNLISLEFWGEDPAARPRQNHPSALWPEPEDGLHRGRALKVADSWYHIQDVEVDAATGRLLKLELHRWEANIPALLGGANLTQELGPLKVSPLRESLEQLGNETLVEWKTRTLPGLLASQDLRPTEDLVIRLEKGLLTLDLEGKAIRIRLDARARAEAEQKAQAELAAKSGQPAPPAQTGPAPESERLADLLDQRKAILMAILGSAKQALANLRR